MTIWRLVEVVAVGIAAVIGGAAAAVGTAWLIARLARRWGTDDTPMGRTVEKFGKLSAVEYDALLARADARRERADAKHTDGHAIDSGEPESHSFKLMRR